VIVLLNSIAFYFKEDESEKKCSLNLIKIQNTLEVQMMLIENHPPIVNCLLFFYISLLHKILTTLRSGESKRKLKLDIFSTTPGYMNLVAWNRERLNFAELQ
jgi:hypothetical protein